MNQISTTISNQNLTALISNDPRLMSTHTQKAYLRDINEFNGWRNGRFMTKLLVEQYAASMIKRDLAPSTINRKLAAIRWLARKLADIAHENPALGDTERADIIRHASRVAAVNDVKGERAPQGMHIGTGEITAVMGACGRDMSPAGRRDAAIFAILWSTGLRIGELLALQIDDFVTEDDGTSAVLIVRKGKGGKGRNGLLFGNGFLALADWLDIRGHEDGPLFCRINKGGRLENKSYTQQAAGKMLKKRLNQANVNKPVKFHDFRRTFVGNLLDNGHDLATVQRLAGHSSPTTTSNYDRRGEQTQRQALKSLHVPYTPVATDGGPEAEIIQGGGVVLWPNGHIGKCLGVMPVENNANMPGQRG